MLQQAATFTSHDSSQCMFMCDKIVSLKIAIGLGDERFFQRAFGVNKSRWIGAWNREKIIVLE